MDRALRKAPGKDQISYRMADNMGIQARTILDYLVGRVQEAVTGVVEVFRGKNKDSVFHEEKGERKP